MAKELKPCQCGCGQKCGNMFAQGHDARHKSFLVQTVANGEDFNNAAREELDRRGWTKFLEQKLVVSRPDHSRLMAKERAAEYTETVLIPMKKVAERLKTLGRYKRGPEQILITRENFLELLEMTDEEILALPSTVATEKT